MPVLELAELLHVGAVHMPSHTALTSQVDGEPANEPLLRTTVESLPHLTHLALGGLLMATCGLGGWRGKDDPVLKMFAKVSIGPVQARRMSQTCTLSDRTERFAAAHVPDMHGLAVGACGARATCRSKPRLQSCQVRRATVQQSGDDALGMAATRRPARAQQAGGAARNACLAGR
jgi:hypothetical protein